MYTLKQAAQILKVSTSAVAKLIQRGQLPAQRIGDSMELFISEQDLKEYQDRRRRPGRPSAIQSKN